MAIKSIKLLPIPSVRSPITPVNNVFRPVATYLFRIPERQIQSLNNYWKILNT